VLKSCIFALFEPFFLKVMTTLTTTFLTPANIARRAKRHPNTIKQVAAQMHLKPARTARGDRLFTQCDAERIVAEIERREREALR